jgi:hypothetical protein
MIGSMTVEVGAGQSFGGSFSETLAGGKITGMDMDMNMSVSGQKFELRVLAKDDKVWLSGADFLSLLKIPTDKKWALADPTSSNAQLAAMGNSLSTVMDSGDTGQYATLAAAASDVKYDGQETISGVKADKYELTIDVAKAASAGNSQQQQGMQTLLSGGVKTVPMTLWLDQQGRVVKVVEDFTVQGQSLHTEVNVTTINSNVTITAPDPADVYEG